jgi:glucuronoarabinoxylan endo-1,4-beta-xylanase
VNLVNPITRCKANWKTLASAVLGRRSLGIVLLGCIVFQGCWRLHSRLIDPVTINWDTQHQTIDGFGASATGYAAGFSQEQADQFFSAETGLGLSLLRIRPIADRQSTDCDCVANSRPHQCVQGLSSQIESGDLQIAQMATSRGVRLFAAPWSPPAEMKTSGVYCTGGSMKGNPANYAKYAGQLADSLSLLRNNGVSVEAVSVQNEPDIENEAYDTCRWTGKQIHDFVPVLFKAMSESGSGKIKIAAPEQSTWAFELMSETMSDPAVADKIGVVLGHAYGSQNPSGIPSAGGRHVWQTEVGDGNPFNGSMMNGLKWGISIHNYLMVGSNAWMYWSLDCGEKYFNHENNMCLTGHDGKLAKRAYVLGQYAKFIRPDWRRIGVTNNGSLLVTAYRGPANEFAIVAINPDRSPANDQTFVLNGAASLHSTVTPWITSISLSLAAQQSLSFASDGTTFAYTIPGNSVVTFHGKAD